MPTASASLCSCLVRLRIWIPIQQQSLTTTIWTDKKASLAHSFIDIPICIIERERVCVKIAYVQKEAKKSLNWWPNFLCERDRQRLCCRESNAMWKCHEDETFIHDLCIVYKIYHFNQIYCTHLYLYNIHISRLPFHCHMVLALCVVSLSLSLSLFFF